MGKIESRTGKIAISEVKIFDFLSDFTNFEKFIPPDKIKNFSATSDTCVFDLTGIGRFGLKITDKNPNSLIQISSYGDTPLSILLRVDIQAQDANNSLVKLSVDPDVNPFLMALVKVPLQNFVNSLIDQLEKLKL